MYSGVKQNHEALPENNYKSHHLKKIVTKGSFAYLHICFQTKEITTFTTIPKKKQQKLTFLLDRGVPFLRSTYEIKVYFCNPGKS